MAIWPYAVIREVSVTARDVDVCARQERTRHVYTSLGNEIHIYLVSMTTRIRHRSAYQKFLLEYKPVGCPDVIETPAMTSSRREGQMLILRCAHSAVTYHLVCLPNTNQWRGNVAACNEIDASDSSAINVSHSVGDDGIFDIRPTDILIVITAGVAVVMGSTIIGAGFIAVKRRSSRRTTNQQCRRDYPMNQLALDDSDVTKFSSVNRRPRYALAMYQSLHAAASTEGDGIPFMWSSDRAEVKDTIDRLRSLTYLSVRNPLQEAEVSGRLTDDAAWTDPIYAGLQPMFTAGLCDARCVTLGLSLPVDHHHHHQRMLCRAQLVPYLTSVDASAVDPPVSESTNGGTVLTTLCQQAVSCIPPNNTEQFCVALSDGQRENCCKDSQNAVASRNRAIDGDDTTQFCEGVFRLNTSDISVTQCDKQRDFNSVKTEHSSITLLDRIK